MNYIIRQATEHDFPEVMNLIKELAVFEKAPESVTNSASQMSEEKDYFSCLVAETASGEIIAFALFYFVYYTWVGKSLYLDDLYVKQEYRKNRVGSALLSEVFRIARNEKCKRVRWQVLEWNKPAIELYRKSGAIIDNEWLNCTFDEKGIRDFKLD